MPPRVKALYRRLGRTERVFLLLLVLWAASPLVPLPGPAAFALTFAMYGMAVAVAIRWSRRVMEKAMWRLRNRLIVTYLFIGVVPIVLILALAVTGAYVITGQVAVYLVSSELERRTRGLSLSARALADMNEDMQPETLRQMTAFIQGRFPSVEVLVRGSKDLRFPETSILETPPKGWKESHGILLRGGAVYAWAHEVDADTEVTVIARITREFLAQLSPRLGDVSFLGLALTAPDLRAPRRDLIPQQQNIFDEDLRWLSPVSVDVWERPGRPELGALIVHSRPSAVLSAVFGQTVKWTQGVLVAFILLSLSFLAVELLALDRGVRMARTITGAVHELYEGTLKVQGGDFSYRIPVRGKDQIAELTGSFNHMTENLERLFAVEKEKERIQSELMIAREVQNQLFPRSAPVLRSLQLTGVCRPARMVSGDYYDFMALQDSAAAIAIGDVAGKGISAALLMASIHSIMRSRVSSDPSSGVPDLVEHLNRQLYASTSPEKYATFCFGIYEDRTGRFTYTNAGHLQPILLRRGAARLLEVTGTVVGAFPNCAYEERHIDLEPGDLLVFYTDGVAEPENAYEEAFGEQRLIDVVLRHAHRDGPEIISKVMEAVDQWTGAPELSDDMTIVLARRV
jgi:sigma-B regulation protein RsbU (phosphoserine phosphatase)